MTLTDEGVNNDSNEQIQEDRHHNNNVRNEVDKGFCRTSAYVRLHIVINKFSVSLGVYTLEEDTFRSCHVIHDTIPGFTGRTTDE